MRHRSAPRHAAGAGPPNDHGSSAPGWSPPRRTADDPGRALRGCRSDASRPSNLLRRSGRPPWCWGPTKTRRQRRAGWRSWIGGQGAQPIPPPLLPFIPARRQAQPWCCNMRRTPYRCDFPQCDATPRARITLIECLRPPGDRHDHTMRAWRSLKSPPPLPFTRPKNCDIPSSPIALACRPSGSSRGDAGPSRTGRGTAA